MERCFIRAHQAAIGRSHLIPKALWHCRRPGLSRRAVVVDQDSDIGEEAVLKRLREWLFANVMSGVANGEAEIAAFASSRNAAPPRPGYSDTLAAVSAVQRKN